MKGFILLLSLIFLVETAAAQTPMQLQGNASRSASSDSSDPKSPEDYGKCADNQGVSIAECRTSQNSCHAECGLLGHLNGCHNACFETGDACVAVAKSTFVSCMAGVCLRNFKLLYPEATTEQLEEAYQLCAKSFKQ